MLLSPLTCHRLISPSSSLKSNPVLEAAAARRRQEEEEEQRTKKKEEEKRFEKGNESPEGRKVVAFLEKRDSRAAAIAINASSGA